MAVIGIFDSGVGGLSVMREIHRSLPCENYIYYADNANCPYGGKSPGFVLERSREITLELVRRGAEIIVVACNTATAAAIASLRKEFSAPSEAIASASGGRIIRISFIGIEPAVKPAATSTSTGVIGVLATAGTLAGDKYKSMKKRFEGQVKIAEHVGKGFVELVESGIYDGPEAERTVRGSLIPLLESGADTIVLGCTHYPFLTDVMKKVADEYVAASGGNPVRFIDPAPAIARRVKDALAEDGISQNNSPGGIVLLSSGPGNTLEETFSRLQGPRQ